MREFIESTARFIVSVTTLAFINMYIKNYWIHLICSLFLIGWVLLPLWDYIGKELKEWVKKRWK